MKVRHFVRISDRLFLPLKNVPEKDGIFEKKELSLQTK
jgi:hypothetical protein